MAATTWPRHLFRRSRPRPQRAAGRRPRSWEPLEDRIAPAGLAITVTTLLDTGNPSGTTSLRQAIVQADANPGSTITFDSSLFTSGPGTIALGGALPVLSEDVTITGPGAATLSVQGGGAASDFTVLTIDAGVTAAVSGLTIEQAHTTSTTSGAGIDNSGTLTLTSSVVSGNSSQFGQGGGIFNHAGRLSLVDSVVSGNTSGNAGGGVYSLGGSMSLLRSTVSGNTTGLYGGGIFVNESTLTLTGSTISGNTTSNNGGGLFLYNAVATVTGSTFSDNSAQADGGGILNKGTLTLTGTTLDRNSAGGKGGGIENQFNALTLVGSTLSGNTAQTGGGGIDNLYGPVSLTNSTLSGNTSNAGGGIANAGTLTLTNVTLTANHSYGDSGGAVTNTHVTILFNTLAAGNLIGNGSTTPGDIQGAVDASSSNNLVGVGDAMTGITNGSQGNLIGTTANPIDAKLGTLGLNGGPTLTVALLAGSPAIDAGSTAINGATVPTADQRGAQRGPAGLNAGNTVDIGAYEATSSYLVTSTADDGTVVGTLRTAIAWADVSTNANPANLASPAPNTVKFDTNGVFATAQTIVLSTGLEVEGTGVPEEIQGPGAALLTIQGGGPSSNFCIFEVQAGVTATLSGVTLTGGRSIVGGGIINRGTLTVTESRISGNTATSSGGGIYNHGTLALADSTVSGNTATYGGGGIVNYPASSTLTLTGSTVSGNSSGGSGGGISNSGTVVLTNSTVSGNTTTDAGGGIVSSGTLTMSGSTVSGNTTRDHGGGFWNSGTAKVWNSTFFGNTANYGGALYNYVGSTSLTNVTITANRANLSAGGGIAIRAGTASLANTLVAGNFSGASGTTPGDVVGVIVSSSANNLIGDGDDLTGISDGSQGNQIGTASSPIDAKLGTLADNGGPTLTVALLPGSPALQAGSVALAVDPTNGQPLAFDQRGLGFPRTVGGKVDIGAFENQSVVVTTTLDVTPSTGTYGGTTTLTATLTASGQGVGGQLVDFHLGATDLGTALTNAQGVATLSNVSLAGIHAGNYADEIQAAFAGDPSFAASQGSASLTVTPAALTITADNATKVYGAALPTLSASYSGFVNGDTPSSLTTPPTLSTTASASSHVGNYPITASGAVDPDYTITYVAGVLSVTPAALTITANDASKVYGAALPALSASYNGFVNGDTPSSLTTPPTLSTTATASSHVGSYPITASGAVDPDYTISYVAGLLTVTPAPLTITANDATKVYGAALPALSVSYSGFVNGDTPSSLTTPPTVGTTATSSSHVGTYPVTASGAVDPDYSITYVAGALVVTPAALTITANSTAKVYGAALPALTASYSGFVNGDTPASLTTLPTLRTAATTSSHVGTYAITASGAVDPDYTIHYVAGNLRVTPAALTITANSLTTPFGGAVPPLTASYSGFVNGDTPASLATAAVLSTTATSNSPAGTYPIVVSGASSPDYVITFVNGTVTVGAYVPPANPVAEAGARYLTTLYHEVLNRGPEPLGMFYWQRRWRAGEARSRINLSFATSKERRALVQAGHQPTTPLLVAFADARRAALAGGLGATSLPAGPMALGLKAHHRH